MKTALIGGIGNVLLGDDGVGPYVIHLLESRYSFGANVEIADLGTPALDLTHRLVGRDTVILVDAVASGDAAGVVHLYRKEEILQIAPAQRLDPHSPALSECLLASEMLGESPRHVLVVGIAVEQCEPGTSLSEAVHRSVDAAITAILEELTRLGFQYETRPQALEPGIWWEEPPELLAARSSF